MEYLADLQVGVEELKMSLLKTIRSDTMYFC
jgi:hypothetical protein